MERQLGVMFHFDVDVSRVAEVIARDRVHVIDQSCTYC